MSAKTLVIGSSARAHMLYLKHSETGPTYVAPGNGGIPREFRIDLDVMDFPGITKIINKKNFENVTVSPEVPLAAGIKDYIEERTDGVWVFGPNKKAAQVEASKLFTNQLADAAGVPAAKYVFFTDLKEALNYLGNTKNDSVYFNDRYREILGNPYSIVAKADGLAGGKGVSVCGSLEEVMSETKKLMTHPNFKKAGKTIIFEERLIGPEFVIQYFVDRNHHFLGTPPCMDQKQVGNYDTGPNTGSTGGICPVPLIIKYIKEQVDGYIKAFLGALKQKDITFEGCLYYSGILDVKDKEVLIRLYDPSITKEEIKQLCKSGAIKIKLIEYNNRFGAPEAELGLDKIINFNELYNATREGCLNKVSVDQDNFFRALSIAMAKGYPRDYSSQRGLLITIGQMPPGVTLFHAGTEIKNEQLVVNGGRVLETLGIHKELPMAICLALAGNAQISFPGKHLRFDIGRQYNPFANYVQHVFNV
jgi:phosphoribosylamine--glycine ligase